MTLSIVSVVGLSLKSKLNYDSDGKEIVKLISEFKAMGVPTTMDGYIKLYPVLSEAEKGSTIDDRTVNTNARNFPSSHALLVASTKADRFLLDEYLKGSVRFRQGIIQSATSQSGNLGLQRVLVFAYGRDIVREFCLAALSGSLNMDVGTMTANLRYARYVANCVMQRPDGASAFFGVECWRIILTTALRLIELSPSMTNQILAFLETPNLVAKPDVRAIILAEFLSDINGARFLDSPLLDQPRPPAFLNKWIKSPTREEIYNAGVYPKDDNVPKSKLGRMLLRERLESWKPFIISFLRTPDIHQYPNFGEYDDAVSFSPGSPDDFQRIFEAAISSAQSSTLFLTPIDFETVFAIVKNSLKVKEKTGAYPSTLKEAFASANPHNYRYRSTSRGFVVEVIWHDLKRPNFVHYRISYPLEDSIPATMMKVFRKQVAKGTKNIVTSK